MLKLVHFHQCKYSFILFQYRKSLLPESIWNSTDSSKVFKLMLETNSTEIDSHYFESRKKSEEFYIKYAHQMNETILEVSDFLPICTRSL